jgi:hypothetical protein
MQHEVVAVAAGERFDSLLVAAGAQRGDHQGLGFAAREQGGTVGARQDAGADGDRPHGARVAAVDARLAGEDAAAHHLGFHGVEQVLDDVGLRGVHVGIDHFLEHPVAHHVDGGLARLLLLDRVGLVQIVAAKGVHLLDQCGRGLRSGPIDRVLAGFVGQIVDGVDGGLHLVVAEDHGAKHDIFRQLIGFRLDHQHGAVGAGNHQIQLGKLELGLGRVEHVLAIDIADARRAQGAAERQAGQGQGGRGADQGGDVGIDFGIGGQSPWR